MGWKSSAEHVYGHSPGAVSSESFLLIHSSGDVFPRGLLMFVQVRRALPALMLSLSLVSSLLTAVIFGSCSHSVGGDGAVYTPSGGGSSTSTTTSSSVQVTHPSDFVGTWSATSYGYTSTWTATSDSCTWGSGSGRLVQVDSLSTGEYIFYYEMSSISMYKSVSVDTAHPDGLDYSDISQGSSSSWTTSTGGACYSALYVQGLTSSSIQTLAEISSYGCSSNTFTVSQGGYTNPFFWPSVSAIRAWFDSGFTVYGDSPTKQ